MLHRTCLAITAPWVLLACGDVEADPRPAAASTWVAVINEVPDASPEERLVLALHISDEKSTAYLCAREELTSTHSGWLETELQGDSLVGVAKDAAFDLQATRQPTADGSWTWQGTLNTANRSPVIWTAVAQERASGFDVYEGTSPACRAGAVVFRVDDGPAELQGTGCDEGSIRQQVVPVSRWPDLAGFSVRLAEGSNDAGEPFEMLPLVLQ